MSVPPILFLGESERSWLIVVREEGRQRAKYSSWLRSQYHIRRPTEGEVEALGIDACAVPENAKLFAAISSWSGENSAYESSYLGILFAAENSLRMDFEKLNAGAAKTIFIRCSNYTGSAHIQRDEKFPRNLG